MDMNQQFKTIKLERTMCYGTCLVYLVSIHYSGRVTYTGKDWVKKTGRHIWKLDSKSIDKLSKALLKSDYFNLKKEEGMVWCTDMPFCITTIEMMDGTKRKIEHYLQEPDEWPKALLRFEKQIDKIIGVKNYVGDENVLE
ncbi:MULTISPECIES: DUF6438 domain-containing protein [unclassified Carboxylicivirga]|uniref:DUF6438 domain-containing protein n=1 Tax=Carboxylicivirga TaxID=1628153 RepID=UPI003D3498D4